MKRLFILFSFTCISFSIYAQAELNNTVYDEMNDEEMIIGYCNREGLNSEPFNSWFQSEYENYEIDQETLDQIDQELLTILEIKIILGTWCSDSQREVPRFYKIMDYLNFKSFSLICVDHLKEADKTEVDELNIEFVPTFIFYMDEQEVGRIIESPEESLEKDIYKILSKF